VEQPPEPSTQGAYAYPQVQYPQVQYPQAQYPPTPYGQAPYPHAPYAYDPYPGALYPAPHPPAPVRKRSRLRPLWIALAYLVPFGMLLGAAAVVTPIVFPAPIASQVRLEGPATAEELADLLQAPAGTAEGEPEVLQLADEATDLDGGALGRARVAERGYRWSVRLPWTGTDGSEGWLRLVQFRTVEGAQEHHWVLFAHAADRTHGEEWSVPDAPRASVFTYDTFATGYVAHAVFGKGTVAAEALISHATRDAHEDLMALVYDVIADLPGDLWEANRLEVQPVDVADFMMPPPDGMRLSRPVRTIGLVETSKILYADPEGAEDFLMALGHMRTVDAEFRRGANEYVYVTIMRFRSDRGSRGWFNNDSHGIAEFDPYRTGDIPEMVDGEYFVFRTGGVITHGYAIFRKGHYGVQIYTVGARTSTSDKLVSLAQTQFDLLPA